MDFLDPKHKKSHRQRLLIGYVLMAVAVAMGTLILLYNANGFDIDRKTGNIIQNGTVFLNSQPGGSTVYLDGVVQRNKTESRLALPGSKQYTIKLENDGYRDWTRTFSLVGGQIERLTYPLLIPKTLLTKDVQLYANAPGLASQSLDKRWLLVQQSGQTYVFDLFDLNNPGSAPVALTIPAAALTESEKSSVISVLEWAEDDRHVLLDRSYEGKHEFIVLNTENIDSTLSINKSLGVSPAQVSLRDKKSNQFYLFSSEDGSLRTGDTNARTISAPILSNVLNYRSFGPEIVLYITAEGATEGKVNFRIRENNEATYLLRSVPGSGRYLLEAAEYDGTSYFVVGSEQENAAFVYRDPLPTLKGQSNTPLLVTTVLRIAAPQFVSFSEDGQFISAQSGSNLAVYDIENDRQYKLDLEHSLPKESQAIWMDTHHLTFKDSGTGIMVDFDGSNEQKLVPSSGQSVYFDPDFKNVFALSPSVVVNGRFALTQTSLVKE